MTRLRGSLLVFALFVSTGTNASDTDLKVITPPTIDHGGIVPIEISVATSDAIVELSLSIENNPEGHRKAFAVSFPKPQKTFWIGTRIRMASPGVAPLLIRTTHSSGKEAARSFASGNVLKAIDFNTPDSLNVTFNDYKWPTTEVGQTVKRHRQLKPGFIDSRGMLYHPMLPAFGTDTSYFVERIRFTIGNDLIAEFTTSTAMANNPYIRLEFEDERDPQGASITWFDTRKGVYQ